jgi:hypothetical protein
MFSKTKKYKKTKKNRGGGNIGSNCNDPNFSIYTTNMLKLFPYKGGKAIPPQSNMELLQSPEEVERQRLQDEEVERQRLQDEEENVNDMEISDIDNGLDISQNFNNLSENSYDLNDSDNVIRQNIQNDFIRGENRNNNYSHYLDDSEMEPLNLSDLGGGLKQKKSRKSRKSRKCRKSRKSRKSRKCRKSRKSRKRKGGKLYLDDPYKNSEGPQY